ncbi:L-lactate permease [Klebsiella pneumoniae]|uniref:L-lactate permease n=1 Tax=Klebsiella pneumoniae TaxID=573 RepID=A0A4P0YIN0_KLEPN|nr:L-lactate permease [Klebsiella pneumoniae]
MTLARTRYTAGQVIRAWSPFLFLTATVTLWSVPPFKALFAPGGAMYDFVINISVPFLDKMVARMPPVVSAATPYAAVYNSTGCRQPAPPFCSPPCCPSSGCA